MFDTAIRRKNILHWQAIRFIYNSVLPTFWANRGQPVGLAALDYILIDVMFTA